jgi:hypothetical protein
MADRYYLLFGFGPLPGVSLGGGPEGGNGVGLGFGPACGGWFGFGFA